MRNLAELTAERLLTLKVFKTQFTHPFTWANGWKSPIYCDDKKILSYPRERDFYKLEISRIILEEFPEADVVAAVATNAIAMGALVAHQLSMPFVYVYPQAKDHGLENQIEGDVRAHQKVVVLENQVSLGVHAMSVVNALQQSGCEVLGVITIIDFGLQPAHDLFEKNDVKLVSLTTLGEITKQALELNWITPEAVAQIKEWHKNPTTWKNTKAK